MEGDIAGTRGVSLSGAPGFPGVGIGAFGLAGRPELFLDLASRAQSDINIPFVNITRDYWLTSCLYGMNKAAGPEALIYKGQGATRTPLAVLAFAGGTSLVSAWGVTERYSEDLDVLGLIVDPDATRSAREKPLKMATKWAADSIGLDEDEVSIEHMSNVGFRRTLLKVGDDARFLKIEATVEDHGEGLWEMRTVTSLMGRFATPEELEQHPELGRFEMPCITPAYTAANKLDALHWRAASGDYDSLIARGRDLYDLAAIADSEYGAAARAAIPELAGRAAQSSGARAAVPRPALGYANSILFKPGSQAQDALRMGYQQIADLVWGDTFSFGDALERAASLDSH